MKTFLPKSGLLTFVFLITNLFFASGAFAQFVSTDLLDYALGSTAIISGSGFQAGETITLVLEHVSEEPGGTDPQYHQPWIVVADDSGNFESSWYVPTVAQGDAPGTTLLLTADGSLVLANGSYAHAEWSFTGVNKVEFAVTGLPGETSVTITGIYFMSSAEGGTGIDNDTFIAKVIDVNRVVAADAICFDGKGIAKVKMCHQTGSPKNPCTEICVDESAVASHLAHGDVVGVCGTSCQGMAHSRSVVIGKEEIIGISEFNVIAYPNPSNHQFTLAVQGGSDEQVEVVVYDMLARMVKRIAKPNAKDIQFGEELPSGEYLLLVRQGENQKAINVIKK